MSREYDYTNLFEKANKEIDLLEKSKNKQEQEIFIEVKMALLEINNFAKQIKTFQFGKLLKNITIML